MFKTKFLGIGFGILDPKERFKDFNTYGVAVFSVITPQPFDAFTFVRPMEVPH